LVAPGFVLTSMVLVMSLATGDGAAAVRHVTVRTSMRPPRAVVLFRGDEHWRHWARRALAAAQETWAGGGHLIVPYSDTGVVAPVLLPVLTAFDPDHVRLFEPTARVWEAVDPGRVCLNDAHGNALVGESLASVLASDTGDFRPHDPAGDSARDYLERHLTPFVEHWADGETPFGLVRSIASGDVSGLTRAPVGDLAAAHVAVPRSWSSDAALVAGSIVGFRNDGGTDPDPIADCDLLGYAYSVRGSAAPPAALWCGPASDPARSLIDLLDSGVIDHNRGFSREAGAVVVGDTAEDFCLAMAYRLLLGTGVWLTSQMLADEDTLNRAVGVVVRDLAWRARNRGPGVRYVSGSLDEDALSDALAKIESSRFYSIAMDEAEDLGPTPPPDIPRTPGRCRRRGPR